MSSLVHKEEKRRYIVYTPAAYEQAPLRAFPVVFNFHGGGMSMAEQMLYTQMNKTAERQHFVVVYPARHQAGLERGLRHGLPGGQR